MIKQTKAGIERGRAIYPSRDPRGTSSVRLSEAERASDARLRASLDIETVGVLFFTADGRIVDGNDAFLRMVCFTREDLAARRLRWDELTPPEWMPRTLRVRDELIETGKGAPFEKEYFRKDGSRWWGLFASKMLDDEIAVASEEDRGTIFTVRLPILVAGA